MWLFIACGSLLLAPQPLPRGFYPAARHAGVKLSVAEPPPKPIESSSFPAIFTSIEKSLEAVAGNPQLLLEAVVGIDKGTAKYDRDNILDYFKARPQLMVARAFDFLMAFRRVKAAWHVKLQGELHGSLDGRRRMRRGGRRCWHRRRLSRAFRYVTLE